MQTPIYNFVQNYIKSGASRFHMPGHKGKSFLGIEPFDITEIKGADELYSPSGLIAEREEHATKLFGTAHTYYSTEGSTLAIKAMLALALNDAQGGSRPTLLAGRNAHKALIFAAALLDFDVEWLYGDDSHACECKTTPDALRARLSAMSDLPFAVYITSPDYLGNIADVGELAKVCDEFGIPLLVDNAHGAYLAHLEPSLHPIALGASMCADSAHKTLPVLTGGAYMHIAKRAAHFTERARSMISLFASTSPSYLILESLDLANAYMADGFKDRLAQSINNAEAVKGRLAELGFAPEATEPLKIVIRAAKYGYSGDELADRLREFDLECEFSDRDYLVLMLTPENDGGDLARLLDAFARIKPKEAIEASAVKLTCGERKCSIREAIFAPSEKIPTKKSVGRILATPTVSCPPAVPIGVSGELITEDTVNALLAYEIEEIEVIK